MIRVNFQLLCKVKPGLRGSEVPGKAQSRVHLYTQNTFFLCVQNGFKKTKYLNR